MYVCMYNLDKVYKLINRLLWLLRLKLDPNFHVVR